VVPIVAELGDLTRFDKPSQLMSYLGLTPSESSTGDHRHQGARTKTGNAHARHALIKGAWTYRYPAKVSRHLHLRLENLPKPLLTTEVISTPRFSGGAPAPGY
jgi:transposase